MLTKKSFTVYYLLLVEGTTEFNIFAYLTRVRYKESFEKSLIRFSEKVHLTKEGVLSGKLNGVGDLTAFKRKFNAITNDDRYKGQKLFFILDKDLNESLDIQNLIEKNNHVVQFVEYNSEHLLLKFAGENPRNPDEFNNLREFRIYCKSEFKKHFGKEPYEIKDPEFELIFNNVTDEQIRDSFKQLFATLS